MKRFALLCLVLNLASIAYGADKYRVTKVETINMNEDYADVIKQLVIIQLESHRASASNENDAQNLSFKAIATQANLKLYMKAISDGKITWTDSITVNTPDDLDHAIERLIDALVSGDKNNAVANIKNVTKLERDPYRKMKTTNYLGLALGVGSGFGNSYASSLIGAYFLWDLREILVNIDFAFGGNDKKNHDFSSYGIQAIYPFQYLQSQSFYVASGISKANWSYIINTFDESQSFNIVKEETFTGPALDLSVGYFYGRTLDVLLRIDLKSSIIFSEEGDTEVFSSLNLGIGF